MDAGRDSLSKVASTESGTYATLKYLYSVTLHQLGHVGNNNRIRCLSTAQTFYMFESRLEYRALVNCEIIWRRIIVGRRISGTSAVPWLALVYSATIERQFSRVNSSSVAVLRPFLDYSETGL